MNVNEVLANRALQLLGEPLGDYDAVSPARRHQPAPVHQRHLSHGAEGGGHPRCCASWSEQVVALQEAFQAKEKRVRRTWSRSAGRECRTPC